MNRQTVTEWWTYIQSLLSVDGGLYVDAFAIVMLVRLVAVLFGKPPLTIEEAGIWGATIGTYGYVKGKCK